MTKNILHVVNSFDPAGDVTRSVRLLKKYSRFNHEVIVKDRHPFHKFLHFDEAELMSWNTTNDDIHKLFDWSDATIYHFLGAEAGWHEDEKPAAYRNSNSYYNPETDTFFYRPEYVATDFSRYKLLASSHLVAGSFMPGCQFLPALIPIDDPEYTPDYTPRRPCFSFSKQAELLTDVLLHIPNTLFMKQRLTMIPHKHFLEKRRAHATIVLDNISDGHYGLAGMEALAMGLPCICFNHEITQGQIAMLGATFSPFLEVPPSIEAVLEMVEGSVKADCTALRKDVRAWTEEFYNPARLIEEHWDTFVQELVS